MAYRNGGGRVEFDERETFYRDERGPRRSDVEVYERREERERRGPPVREYEDIDVRVRERERESRTPAFLREEQRRTDAGPLVLRQREVETVERPRRRSPSPSVRVRETRIVERGRSPTPPPRPRLEEREDVRIRTVERERVRSPSRGPSMERVRTRVMERERERSPSLSPLPRERVRTRIVERRSPSPIDRDRERIRIVEMERERIPSPSPSPSPPPPPVIRGPTIEREVITHYRDIDHGMIVAPRPPSPPPPPRRSKERDTEIDIYTSRNATEVDIHRSSRERGRSVSRERRSPARVYDDEVLVQSKRDRLEVDVDVHRSSSRRRAHSAAPLPTPDYKEEAEYITSRIDSRGRVGEAWHGATKDWAIVDVPPGTERVRMDGAGGGSAEVTWQRYSGVRRSKFIPERDGQVVSTTTTISDRDVRERERERESKLSVQIYDKDRDRERDIEVEKITDRRVSVRGPPPPPAPPKRAEMWTEITKDLVVRQAIQELGYEYEETEWFFYIMQYLRYEDVLELVQLSDSIRRARKERAKEIQWEREWRNEYEREHRHAHRHRHSHHRHSRSIDRVEEREVIYDSGPRVRGYIR